MRLVPMSSSPWPNRATSGRPQDVLLEEINQASESIRDFGGDPELTTLLILHRSKLYKKLADTFNPAVVQGDPFDQQEIDEYATLLSRADARCVQSRNWPFPGWCVEPGETCRKDYVEARRRVRGRQSSHVSTATTGKSETALHFFHE